jgi:hypothetical protein
MAGKGPAPQINRRRAGTPARGDWRPSTAVGWQYGLIPEPPAGLTPASLATWDAWMQSWWASHWQPGDLPVLRMVISLWDLVERGRASGALRAELRQWLDNIGASPKGRQDRRWAAPQADETPRPGATGTAGPYYAGLHVLGDSR